MPSKVVSGVGSTSLRRGSRSPDRCSSCVAQTTGGETRALTRQALLRCRMTYETHAEFTEEIEHAIPLPKGWELCKHEDEDGNEFRYYANEATGAEQSHRPRELQPGWVEKHNEDKTECWYEREETGERRGMNERPDLSVQEEIDKLISNTQRRLSVRAGRDRVAVNTALAEHQDG